MDVMVCQIAFVVRESGRRVMLVWALITITHVAITCAVDSSLPHPLAQQVADLRAEMQALKLVNVDPRLTALEETNRAQGTVIAKQSRLITSLQTELSELKNVDRAVGVAHRGRRQMQSCDGEAVTPAMFVKPWH